jgi:hypothetical protein
MDIFSDSVSSVVASAYLRCGILFIGLAIASAEEELTVVATEASRSAPPSFPVVQCNVAANYKLHSV